MLTRSIKNEFKIIQKKKTSLDDFNKYSGTSFEQAKRFLNTVIKNIPEWDNYVFELFYSGYAGFTIIDEHGDKLGYLMYDKNIYGLDDVSEGKGWYLKPVQGKESLLKTWIRIINKLAQKPEFRPNKARM